MLDTSIENPNTANAWYISSSQIHVIYNVLSIATAPKYEEIWMLSEYLDSKRARKSDVATFLLEITRIRGKKSFCKHQIFEGFT